MRNRYIIGNWKMHGNKTSIAELLNNIRNFEQKDQAVHMIVCPPYVFLEQTQDLLKKSQLQWGAQNMAAERRVHTRERYQALCCGSLAVDMCC